MDSSPQKTAISQKPVEGGLSKEDLSKVQSEFESQLKNISAKIDAQNQNISKFDEKVEEQSDDLQREVERLESMIKTIGQQKA